MDGGALALDVATLGEPDAPAVLLIVSGTHGVEGFTGSALQYHWLDSLGPGGIPEGLRVVCSTRSTRTASPGCVASTKTTST